ncbi:hypothetical protein MLD38_021554 [Melastoma candidum]|uniref:Uncharacterized protein n=1 Tax=Melastoma candidum TaxID=119954 RepID=A0ACB9QHF0_9MYRT|nr:hypothetical protein MLD38_021554 [Melastoma candidum]
MHQPIIPGLPDDLALRCLAKVSHGYHGRLEAVSKRWKEFIRSEEFSSFKAREGWCGNWLFVLTEGSDDQWVAYDPHADIWHPLPKIEREQPCKHLGFSCVCVGNKFLVIGGAYSFSDPTSSHKKPVITNDVFQFDPFRKVWTQASSMMTPRSHFACSVVAGKVYVAGGRNMTNPRGLVIAEVYDPLRDRWEELVPMHLPQMDCIGLSYKGKFHVLSDQVGLLDENMSQVFCPLSGTWSVVQDSWPFSRAMQVAVQVMEEDHIYTLVDWGESLIKTRDSGEAEWYNVGKVPPVILPDHSRPLEVFDYGFAALGRELYVMGGKVLKWEESGAGSFNIGKLNRVRVCDPSVSPLKWREARSMCLKACGSILGCTSLNERSIRKGSSFSPVMIC